MKKQLISLLAVLVLFSSLFSLSCTSGPEGAKKDQTPKKTSAESTNLLRSPYPGPPEIYPLLQQWEKAVRNKDMELIRELMPEAQMSLVSETRERIEFNSYRSIESFRFDYFKDLGPYESYKIGNLRKLHDDDPDFKLYQFDYSHLNREYNVSEGIGFHKTENEWRIASVNYIRGPRGAFVTNHLMAAADINDDGFLTAADNWQYTDNLHLLFSGPHENTSSLDPFFDANEDGFIEQDEIEAAAELYIMKGMRFTETAFNMVNRGIDTNNDEHMDDKELQKAVDLLSSPLEAEYLKIQIINGLSWLPIADYIFQSTPRAAVTYLDTLADANDDGWIDEIEQKIMESGFVHQHNVEHYFDAILDRNNDGFIDWNEPYVVLQASAKDWGNVMLTPPPYPVHTPTDHLLDKNEDGLVDEDELKTLVILFSGQKAAANLLKSELKTILDLDQNNSVEEQEIQKVKAVICYPRKVNLKSSLEIESDKNSDGFLDVTEIGIIAGSSAGTPITHLDDRIELYRLKEAYFEEESSFNKAFLKNRERMKSRNLAVLNVEIGITSLNREITDLVTVFVENAFVNQGSMKLVDRRNLDTLLDEMKLQYSGIVNEDSIVEIGEIAGAEIIAVSELHEMEGRYFLSVKVLDVATSSVLGSSIASADNSEELLKMANDAVHKLM